MTQEIIENRGVGDKKDHINLQLHHLPEDILNERLPGIVETGRIFAGVDITKEPVPVIPTVHYNMGGIPTNYKGEVMNGKERVEGLYAVGEASCASVHGANRLGANSLLDLVVFGRSTGKNIVEKNKKVEMDVDDESFDKSLKVIDDLLETKSESNTGDFRNEMQETMQKYASVYKSKELLEEGFEIIKNLYQKKNSIVDKTLIWNTDLIEALELKNMLDLSYLTVSASLFREESRGSHFRYDFPERNDEEWMYHTLSRIEGKKVINEKCDVNMNGLYPDEMESVPPAKRVY